MSTETKVKERPVLFNTSMVQAILRDVDPKTMTRRPIVPQPPNQLGYQLMSNGCARPVGADYPDCESEEVSCPLGKPGDLLWVRETWGEIEWRSLTSFGPLKKSVVYKAGPHPFDRDRPHGWSKDNKWRPSIHMPRIASRITLAVTEVQVERVQDISAADAIAEGIISSQAYSDDPDAGLCKCPDCGGKGVHGAFAGGYAVTEVDCTTCDTTVKRFRILWDSIYAKKGLGWDANPGVWATSFKRVAA